MSLQGLTGGGVGGSGGGSGNVTGAASSTDKALVRFSGTGGKTIQNGVVVESDAGDLTAVNSIVVAPATDVISAVVKRNSAVQTSNVVEVQTETGTALFTVDASGNVASGSITLAAASNLVGSSTSVVYTGPGAVGTPSLSQLADPDTGIYFPAANQTAVATNGVQRLLVTTASVTSALPVVLPAGTISANALQVVQAGTGLYQPATNVLGVSANGIDVARFNTVASGVDYLTFTPGASTANAIIGTAGPAGAIGLTIAPQTNGNILLNTTGRIQIGGTTSGQVALTADGSSGDMFFKLADGTGGYFFVAPGVAFGLSDGSGSQTVRINSAGPAEVYVQSSGVIGFASGTTTNGSTPDAAFSRLSAAGTIAVGTGAQGSTAGHFRVQLGRVSKTGNYTVLTTDTKVLFDNVGASGEVDFTLPAAAVGLIYEFNIRVAQTLKVIAVGSDTIRLAASVSAAAGNISGNAIGNYVRLVGFSGGWDGLSAGSWVVT